MHGFLGFLDNQAARDFIAWHNENAGGRFHTRPIMAVFCYSVRVGLAHPTI
jgi:hypothetical protein